MQITTTHNVVLNEENLVKFFELAMSIPAVQSAIVKAVSCSTPIGIALNDQILAHQTDLDAENISGLERFVESAIEDFMRNNDCNVKADDIQDLEETVLDMVSKNHDLVNEISDAVLEKIAEKLSR